MLNDKKKSIHNSDLNINVYFLLYFLGGSTINLENGESKKKLIKKD